MNAGWRLVPVGEVSGPFTKPATVEVVSPHEIYVVDDSDPTPTTTWTGRRRIWRVTDVGPVEIPLPDPNFDPDDIAIGRNGSLYAYHSGPAQNCLRLGPDGTLRQAFALGEGLSRVAIDRLGRIWTGYIEPADGCWLKLFEANGRLLWSSDDRHFREVRDQLGPVTSVYDIAIGEDGTIYLALGGQGKGPILTHLGRDRKPISSAVQRRFDEDIEADCLTLSEGLIIATPAKAGFPWMLWDGRSEEVAFADLEVDSLLNPYISGLSAHNDLICACIPQLCRLLVLRLEQQ